MCNGLLQSVVGLNPTQGSFFFESCPGCISLPLPASHVHMCVIARYRAMKSSFVLCVNIVDELLKILKLKQALPT